MKQLAGLLGTLGVLSTIVSAAVARVATIQTSIPGANHLEPAIKAAAIVRSNQTSGGRRP
jgi:hypothetical protein